MSRRIGDMMARISQESSISDPTGVITVSELAIEELPEVEVEEVDNPVEELEAISGATTSLESNLRHINSLVDQGIGLEPSMVKHWQDSITTSMEAFGIDKEVYEEGLASVQLSFENNSSEDYSPEALDKIKDTIARLWEMFLAALKRTGEWLKKHWNNIFGAAEKLIKAGEALGREVDKVKNDSKDIFIEKDNQYVYLTYFIGDGTTRLSVDADSLSPAIGRYDHIQTLAERTFEGMDSDKTVFTTHDIQRIEHSVPARSVDVVPIGHKGDITIINSNSLSIKVTETTATGIALLPKEFPALSLNSIKSRAEGLVRAGKALRNVRGLENAWKRSEAKAGKITTETEAAEIARKNAVLTLAVNLTTLDNDYLLSVANATYKYASESLKAQVKAN